MKRDTELIYGDICYQPAWLIPLSLAAGLPIFLYFVFIDEQFKGFVSLLSICSVVVSAISLHKLKYTVSYWIVNVISVFLHIVLVSNLAAQDSHFPGVILAPFVIFDLIFWQFLTIKMANLEKNIRNNHE